ncbi:unnamed protein product [Closterium sp. NIES-65]|nr:unnamed protein product [Closterium sp. NIES-65]
MFGLTQDQAYALLTSEKTDELLETIISAYERCKRHHDFVVIEGTSMRDGTNTSPLNGLIASALEAPALLLSDGRAASQFHPKHTESGGVFEDWDWEKEAAGCILDHARIMRQSRVDVAGALIYRMPKTSRGAARLREYITRAHIPFVGAIPEDVSLESFQVEDVARVLNAHVLYGDVPHSNNMTTEVTRTLVATLHLADLLSYIPPSDDPGKGVLVVAHASRPDILLGMIDLHETHLSTQVAAMVLTGGSPPPLEVDMLIRSRPTRVSLPVLLSPKATHDTCIALTNAQPELHATSHRKIERAEVIFHENVDMRMLHQVLFKERPLRMNPKLFQHTIFDKSREAQSHIVLPEGAEPRTIQAAGEVLRRSLCRVTLIGHPDEIITAAKQLRVDVSGADIVYPPSAPNLDHYAELLYQARKDKGVTLVEAHEHMITDPNYLGTAMVAAGDVDGMVSGAVHTTIATIRPALQMIPKLPNTAIISSVFFMCLPDHVYIYGDCAINSNPTAEELAMIAISSADTAAAFGVEPRVAMLSYSTLDERKEDTIVQKVVRATQLVKQQRPDLLVEGPLQYDAAVNPMAAHNKMDGRESDVAGKASVLIFPDLNTGNNTYKAVQQATGAIAMGPVLQGLSRPVNDLSRGCTTKDIVHSVVWNCLGEKLGSGSVDQTIRVWQVDPSGQSNSSKHREVELRGHSESVDNLCWDPLHPDLLASASQDKSVRIWDTRSARCQQSVTLKGENINVTYKPDGTHIAVGNSADELTILDVRKLKPIHKRKFTYELNEFAWDRTGSIFLVTTGTGAVEVLGYPSLQTLDTLHAHTAGVYSLAIDPLGRYFAAGSADALVSLWDMQHMLCVRTFTRLEWPVRTVSFSHDGRYLASASEDLFVDIAEVETGRSVHQIPSWAAMNSVEWNPKHLLLAYASDDDGKHSSPGVFRVFGFDSP